MTVAAVYVALLVALIGSALSFAFMAYSMTTVSLLEQLELVNGRLRIAKSHRRQAVFRFVFSLIHTALACGLVAAFRTRSPDAPISEIAQFLIAVFIVLVVLTTTDGFMSRRERQVIQSHSKMPSAAEVQELLKHGDEVDGLMTRHPNND